VDAKYLNSPTYTLYRPASQDVNVIEFKDTIHAQPYALDNVAQFYHPESAATHAAGIAQTGPIYPDVQHFKYEKYSDTETPSPTREQPNFSPYSYSGIDIVKPREPTYGYPLQVMKHAAPEAWGYGNHLTPSSKAAVFLCNRELWSKFHAHTTEMIVTKQGR